MVLSNYEIVFHAYDNTTTGHVNIQFIHNGVSQGWYGSNLNKVKKLNLEI